MSAGLLFGSIIGTIIVFISGTVVASVAFLIARYFARDRILKLVEGNKKFLAIDKAIGENGFRVVTLLRLSPLLPFSLGNYLYGLTSKPYLSPTNMPLKIPACKGHSLAILGGKVEVPTLFGKMQVKACPSMGFL